MSRRLNFLWYILQQNTNSLLSVFFKAQLENPIKGDWILTVLNDLKELKIDMTFDDIQKMSKNRFKKIIKENIKVSALHHLQNLQKLHSKSQNLSYHDLQLQDYLKPGHNMTKKEKCFTFAARTRMLDVRCNFKQGKSDLSCRKCQSFEESQQHLLLCSALRDNSLVDTDSIPDYHDLFSSDKAKIATIARLLLEKFKLLNTDTINCKSMCTDSSGAASDISSGDLE